MESTKSKELKIKSFRVDEETFEKFKHIASNEFGNQGQCLDALINLYEMENSKASLVERKLEIESFQDYLNKINQLFVTSLQMSRDAEGRVREEFLKQLNIKDTTIERLQTREKEYIEKNKALADKYKNIESKVLELDKVNKNLDKDKSTLSQLVSRNYELLEKNKHEIEELESYKEYKKENLILKEQIEGLRKKIIDKTAEGKEQEIIIKSLDKEVEFNKNKFNEIKEGLESYKMLLEATRKDHRKELEVLEGKYSRMSENEIERITKGFEEKLKLEKKSMELTIKTLEQEKRILELESITKK